MGIVYADLTLKNAGDVLFAQLGHKEEAEIRSLKVKALVDTGAGTLVINEEVRQKLGLRIENYRQATLADGTVQSYAQTEPVRIHWKERNMICLPMLLPGAKEILLGAIPLEEMDLIVDPKNQELTGRHGDQMHMILYSMRQGKAA